MNLRHSGGREILYLDPSPCFLTEQDLFLPTPPRSPSLSSTLHHRIPSTLLNPTTQLPQPPPLQRLPVRLIKASPSPNICIILSTHRRRTRQIRGLSRPSPLVEESEREKRSHWNLIRAALMPFLLLLFLRLLLYLLLQGQSTELDSSSV